MKCLLLLLIATFANGDRIVQTNSGPISGIAIDAKNVEAFLGIPYAEPPVGNLRFAKPIPKSPWKDTYHADELPPACIQAKTMYVTFERFFNESLKMDEDCLYLNLWVPKSESTHKPIMVHIHGGGFMVGTSRASLYDGSTLSHHGDVIVATLNYRVGTMGFFSAFIDEAAGSMGMYDQLLAIQWIKENAEQFGGDPDNIVLFGESAGAFSISLHMVSPLSKNLFKRAILEGGSGISPMYSDDNELLHMGSQQISVLLGCATNEELKENPKSVVECMKNLPPEKFSEVESVLFEKMIMLVPKVGDEFLPKNPTDLYRKGEFKESEVLLGVARDEGSMFVIFPLLLEKGDLQGEALDVSAFNETTAREKIQQSYAKNTHAEKIVQKYFKRVEEESRYTYINAASDVIGDTVITCGAVFQADFMSLKGLPVYFYLFDYRSPSTKFPEWVGVPHCEEIQYIFGNPLFKPSFSKYEEELSSDIMDKWVAFARTGNPNVPGVVKWPKYTYEDPEYLIISNRDKVGRKPDNGRCEAWRDLYRSQVDCEVLHHLKNPRH